jgi:glucosamine 6-phosphate synthetase-like amidotransferase/phosphosugar isomerase protein
LRQAIKNVIEQKLIGTWRLVVMDAKSPNCLFTTTNSSLLLLGKSADSIVLSSSPDIATANRKKYLFEKLEKNVLYEITDECLVSAENLTKKMTVQR